MSALCGILHSDGSTADARLLLRMRDCVDYRGPDGWGLRAEGPVGLAHRLLHTTEESLCEKQPMSDGRGVWIAADCRIDNRPELKREFQSKGVWDRFQALAHPWDPPDAAYILSAYEMWKEECPRHLLGDFAFAIWDAALRLLFCARDPVGVKPFVYHWNGRKLLFGSEMKQIFQDPSVPAELDLGHLGELLAGGSTGRESTPYAAVRRLAPGHLLRVEKGQLQVKRYFDWDPREVRPNGASLKENAEVFRELFEEAVRARLRVPSGFQAGSLLSGGLDSSSIVSVAASLAAAAGGPDHRPFPVFTFHFPEADPSLRLPHTDDVNERPYLEAVAQRHRVEFHGVEIRGRGLLDDLEEYLRHQEVPIFFPTLSCFRLLFSAAQASGVRALLHGEGGDEIFSVPYRVIVGELKKGNGAAFLAEWRAWRRVWGVSYPELLGRVARGLLPEQVLRFRHRWVRRPVPDWIHPRFAKEIGLRDRLGRDAAQTIRTLRSGAYGVFFWLFDGTGALYLEALDRAQAESRLELRLPFLDLRLLRWIAGVPWNQKKRNGVSKVLLREALREILPPLVRKRLRKSEFTPAILPALERYDGWAIQAAAEDPHPILRSMTAPEKAKALLVKKPHPFWPLWYLLSLDQWLKRQERILKKFREVRHETEEEIGSPAKRGP